MPHRIGLAAYDLSCQRGGRTVFDGLSFSLSPGEALLVSGPNGAGKTSLLRQIAGLLPLAAGRLSLDGASPDLGLPELCHYVGHLNAVKASFSVRENLAFWAEFLGEGGASLDRALAAFGLELACRASRRSPLGGTEAEARALAPVHRIAADLAARRAAGLARHRFGQAARRALKDHLEAGGIALVASHTPLKTKFARQLALGGKERVA